MHPKKERYIKPQLRVIEPGGAQWRDNLPKVRELTRRALDELRGMGASDVEAKLTALLELIDKELEEAKQDSD